MEEDLQIAELERDYLQANGFVCDISHDGESGLRMALDKEYTLVILGVMLPKRDGFSVCGELRKHKDIPIIFVSAKNEEIDKVRAFGLGADDYMTKPFSPTELVARAKGHIARYEALIHKTTQEKSNVIQIRDLRIDKDAHRVYVAEEEIIMPVREFELLLFLAENPNIVFSKERLFDRLWGIDAMGDVSTVTVHIQRIREKIEKDIDGKKYIETVWGAGYRFKV
jgi:DNA-binding response OmpR family regulator